MVKNVFLEKLGKIFQRNIADLQFWVHFDQDSFDELFEGCFLKYLRRKFSSCRIFRQIQNIVYIENKIVIFVV